MISELRDKLTGFAGDERGVSPVIAVALLIAIAVVLAAVIGFVVLNAGTGPVDNPSARLELSYNSGSDTVVLNHEGGDNLDPANLEVVVNEDGGSNARNDLATSNIIETGDRVSLGGSEYAGGSYSTGDTVKVVWVSPDGGERSQLASITIP